MSGFFQPLVALFSVRRRIDDELPGVPRRERTVNNCLDPVEVVRGQPGYQINGKIG